MASPEYEQLRKALKPGLAIPEDPPDLVREKMHRIHPTQYPDDVRVDEVAIGGVPSAWVSTPESDESRVILMVHGGAFVSTYVEHYIPYLATLTRHFQARGVVFGYRLAPEHRYPAALDDTHAVYRALLAEGIAPDRIVVAGDSCGGGIGIALLLRLRDAGEPLPAAFVGLTGWYDLEASGDAAANPRGVDPYVHPDWIRARGRDYAGPDGNVRDPLLSPIHADLAGLPPLFLSCGEIDITRDDSTRLAACAGRDGVAVTLEVNPEMIHGFHGLAVLIPEGRASLDRAGAFVRAEIP
ncbi:MAG: alpha/beta hydrolase [Myxococcota bacterium]